MKKCTLILSGAILTSLTLPLHAADEMIESVLRSQMEAMVGDQYSVTKNALQAELSDSQAKIQALELERNSSLQSAQAKAELDAAGLQLIRKFDLLILARYIDKKGKFAPGSEVSSKDIENANDLIKSYLSTTPFSGRVSAGQFRKNITWIVDRLEDVANAHRSPTEKNNSDLEIIAKRLSDEEARSKRVLQLAETLGFKLDPNAPPIKTKAKATPTASTESE